MKKFMMFLTFLLIFFINIKCFASEDINNWKFYKEINYTNNSRYKSFFINEQIYKNSKEDLSDIRIINDKNEFMNFIIKIKKMMSLHF